MTIKIAALSLAAAALVSAGVLWQPDAVKAQAAEAAMHGQDPAPNTVEFYNQRVLPILQTNCYRCHGGINHRGGLSIATREGMLRGGHDGSVIVPGDASKSLLVKLIRHEGPADDPMPMPPKSKISDADIATITQWIQAGATMPADAQ
jgi:mono/diheme cytochrome c family protein